VATAVRGFSPETFRHIRRLEIRTRRLVNELFAGRYLSTFKGRGMTFNDVREYQPGDDIRSIDWNVTARMNAPFVKRYAEERELTILLAVDTSASLKFGTRVKSKHELSAELAALVAFSAMRNNDKVGLLLFGAGVNRYVPPRKGKMHALRILRDILVIEPEGKGTDLAGALAFTSRVLRKKAIVFVVSDFIAEGYEKALSVTNKRHDTIAFVLDDEREEEFPKVGRVRLEDLESGETMWLDTGDERVREEYSRMQAVRRAERDRVFKKMGLDAIRMKTGESYVKPLLSFFATRARRLR